ncbi:hypothetical protein JNM05_01890 [bacterium]|nr:hypothetical protein [bacterium]
MKSQKLLMILFFYLIPTLATAGDGGTEKKYQVGIRSTLMTSHMKLSKINPAFNDLSPDGLSGSHLSSLYFLRKITPYFGIGFETLTGNSDAKAETGMDYQGVGLLFDFVAGSKYFAAGGIHMGGILVDAMHKESPAAGKHVDSGTYFKTDGYFLAPYAGVGVNFNKNEIRFLAKSVFMTGKGKMNALNSTYVGLSYGRFL